MCLIHSVAKNRTRLSDRTELNDEIGFPGDSLVRNPPVNVGDTSSISGSGRSPREGNGTPLQYSCLENPMDGGAWWATVHGVAKSQTRLSDFTFTSLLVKLDNTELTVKV